MIGDLTKFNLADNIDLSTIKIVRLKSKNTWLTVGLIVAVGEAVYFAIEYHQLRESIEQ